MHLCELCSRNTTAPGPGVSWSSKGEDFLEWAGCLTDVDAFEAWEMDRRRRFIIVILSLFFPSSFFHPSFVKARGVCPASGRLVFKVTARMK